MHDDHPPRLIHLRPLRRDEMVSALRKGTIEEQEEESQVDEKGGDGTSWFTVMIDERTRLASRVDVSTGKRKTASGLDQIYRGSCRSNNLKIMNGD